MGISLYEGQFLHGEMHGFGRIIYANASYYEGYWANDMHNGPGKLAICRFNLKEIQNMIENDNFLQLTKHTNSYIIKEGEFELGSIKAKHYNNQKQCLLNI